MGPFFFNSAPVSSYFWFMGWPIFLPCDYIISAMHHLVMLAGPAMYLFFLYLVRVAQYFCWVSFHTILGFLAPFYFSRHSWPIPFLHSHGLLSKSFGLPWPNYHILYFKGLLSFASTPFTNSFLWAPSAHLCLLSTSYDSYGLTTSFFGASLGHFAFFGAFLLFYRLVDHYSRHSGLMVFFSLC